MYSWRLLTRFFSCSIWLGQQSMPELLKNNDIRSQAIIVIIYHIMPNHGDLLYPQLRICGICNLHAWTLQSLHTSYSQGERLISDEYESCASILIWCAMLENLFAQNWLLMLCC